MNNENAEILSLQTEANDLYSSLITLVIHSDEDLAFAAERYNDLKSFGNGIEDTRTKLVKPLNNHVKYINGEFHKVTDKLKELEEIIKQRMIEYRKEQAAKLGEEQKKIEQSLAGSPFALSLAKEAPLAQPKTVEGVTFKTVWGFELADFSLVPDQYKALDSSAIRAAIGSGERQIPGIRIYSEEIPAIKGKTT